MSDVCSPKLSGRQLAPQYAERFKCWIAERDVAADWDDYVRSDKLNRSEIAKECNFLRSVFRTNPGVERELVDLEVRLRQQGVLPPLGGVLTGGEVDQGAGADVCEPGHRAVADDPVAQVALRRAIGAKAKAEQRSKALEEQNATLRAEVKSLRDQVRKLNFMDEHLAQSGRLPRP